MIAIIDYRMGNLGSIKNMLRKIGADSIITDAHDVISNADKIILPGVGAFDHAMRNLSDLNLRDLLTQKALVDRIPTLGICLGMQLLTHGSDEGVLDGLGWIDGRTRKFEFSKEQKLKIPHMGWNTIELGNPRSPLVTEMYDGSRFYFVHSYFVDCSDQSSVLMTTNYGHKFVSAVNKDNIYGVQFHPEKSHKFGLQILTNFVKYC